MAGLPTPACCLTLSMSVWSVTYIYDLVLFYHGRFTNARLLFDRVDERLEWKHGRTHVPKGNKRLLCLVDDINLSQVCFCERKRERE